MVIYGVYMYIFLEGKPPNIWSYTVYICTFFWQGSHQIYGHIRFIYEHFFGREATKYMVIYGVYMYIFLEGKPPNICSYTVYICTFCWQGGHQIYGHIQCIYERSGQP